LLLLLTHSVKEDSTGLDMWYKWITSVYLDRHCTGRFWGLREVQVVHVQTGGAQSTRTRMGITWDVAAEVAAQNRSEWRRSVALVCGLNQGQGQGC